MQTFPCPICGKEATAEHHADGRITLRHRGCAFSESPSKALSQAMLEAYVQHCRPKLRYPKIDGHEVLEAGQRLKL